MSENGKQSDPTTKKKLPIIMGLADLSKWDIGPLKDADCALTFTVSIRNWEDVQTVRQLATGQVVVRVMPLQLQLPEGTDCKHPEGLRMAFELGRAVCLECGMILDIPPDDRKDEKPTQEEG